MRKSQPTILCLALMAAFAAPSVQAQSTQDLLKEIKALRERVEELEKKAATPTEPKWGMTPEQVQEFNKLSVKTEALEDSQETLGYKSLKISGFMDPTYIYNHAARRGGFQFANPVSSGGYAYDNSYFGAVSLDLLKETEGGIKWHLNLVPNRGTGAVIGEGSIINEASVQVPLGDLQTKLIAGQIPDWSGYEMQQSTLNKLITHNLLFDFTLPTAYTGAGIELIRGKYDTKIMLANINGSKVANGRKAPSLVARVDYSKGEFDGWGAAGVFGKAPNFTGNIVDADGNSVSQPDSRVAMIEFDTYFIRGDWTWQGQVSYGRQEKAAITPAEDGSLRTAQWWGLSSLLAWKFEPRWEATGRLDYINNRKNGGGLFTYAAADDHNGIGPDPLGDPNIGANRLAFSAGLSYLYSLNTVFKLEYRLDHATQAVFAQTKDGGYTKNNHLLGTSVVVSF